jgi:hypothetical protein
MEHLVVYEIVSDVCRVMPFHIVYGCFASSSIDQVVVEDHSTKTDADMELAYLRDVCFNLESGMCFFCVFLKNEFTVLFACPLRSFLVSCNYRYLRIVNIMLRHDSIQVIYVKWDYF